MHTFFKALAEKTGWAITALMAGPHPAKGGDIDVITYVLRCMIGQAAYVCFSVHIGETPLGGNLPHAHPTFEKQFVVPFGQFAHLVFRMYLILSGYKLLLIFILRVAEAVRQARALPATDDVVEKGGLSLLDEEEGPRSSSPFNMDVDIPPPQTASVNGMSSLAPLGDPNSF